MTQQAFEYVDLFNESILNLFRNALRISLRDRHMVGFLYRTMRDQRRAAQRRSHWQTEGVHVPAFMIASITKRCNLHCKGCYARAQHRDAEPEMSADKLRDVLAEARELGISIILLAGGEPLTRPELLETTALYPEIVFPLFTNGLMIDDQMIEALKSQRHVVPIISLEGWEIDTDNRRGKGVYKHLLGTMQKMKEAGLFFGTSLTVTSQNLGTLTGDTFVQELTDVGCKILFYVDYVPVQPGTEMLELDDVQRQQEARRLIELRQEYPALFVAFPGDEDRFGGCLAAGRGFVHVSAEGRVEPCPFAPYSDASLKALSLKEALGSELLAVIREHSDELEETSHGCALWHKREWVQSLLHRQPAPQAPDAALAMAE